MRCVGRVIGTVIIPCPPLLCSSRSFFQPKEEGKAKKPEKETSNSTREIESPPKYVLWLGGGESVPLSLRMLLAASVIIVAQNISGPLREIFDPGNWESQR